MLLVTCMSKYLCNYMAICVSRRQAALGKYPQPSCNYASTHSNVFKYIYIYMCGHIMAVDTCLRRWSCNCTNMNKYIQVNTHMCCLMIIVDC